MVGDHRHCSRLQQQQPNDVSITTTKTTSASADTTTTITTKSLKLHPTGRLLNRPPPVVSSSPSPPTSNVTPYYQNNDHNRQRRPTRRRRPLSAPAAIPAIDDISPSYYRALLTRRQTKNKKTKTKITTMEEREGKTDIITMGSGDGDGNGDGSVVERGCAGSADGFDSHNTTANEETTTSRDWTTTTTKMTGENNLDSSSMHILPTTDDDPNEVGFLLNVSYLAADCGQKLRQLNPRYPFPNINLKRFGVCKDVDVSANAASADAAAAAFASRKKDGEGDGDGGSKAAAITRTGRTQNINNGDGPLPRRYENLPPTDILHRYLTRKFDRVAVAAVTTHNKVAYAATACSSSATATDSTDSRGKMKIIVGEEEDEKEEIMQRDDDDDDAIVNSSTDCSSSGTEATTTTTSGDVAAMFSPPSFSSSSLSLSKEKDELRERREQGAGEEEEHEETEKEGDGGRLTAADSSPSAVVTSIPTPSATLRISSTRLESTGRSSRSRPPSAPDALVGSPPDWDWSRSTQLEKHSNIASTLTRKIETETYAAAAAARTLQRAMRRYLAVRRGVRILCAHHLLRSGVSSFSSLLSTSLSSKQIVVGRRCTTSTSTTTASSTTSSSDDDDDDDANNTTTTTTTTTKASVIIHCFMAAVFEYECRLHSLNYGERVVMMCASVGEGSRRQVRCYDHHGDDGDGDGDLYHRTCLLPSCELIDLLEESTALVADIPKLYPSVENFFFLYFNSSDRPPNRGDAHMGQCSSRSPAASRLVSEQEEEKTASDISITKATKELLQPLFDEIDGNISIASASSEKVTIKREKREKGKSIDSRVVGVEKEGQKEGSDEEEESFTTSTIKFTSSDNSTGEETEEEEEDNVKKGGDGRTEEKEGEEEKYLERELDGVVDVDVDAPTIGTNEQGVLSAEQHDEEKEGMDDIASDVDEDEALDDEELLVLESIGLTDPTEIGDDYNKEDEDDGEGGDEGGDGRSDHDDTCRSRKRREERVYLDSHNTDDDHYSCDVSTETHDGWNDIETTTTTTTFVSLKDLARAGTFPGGARRRRRTVVETGAQHDDRAKKENGRNGSSGHECERRRARAKAEGKESEEEEERERSRRRRRRAIRKWNENTLGLVNSEPNDEDEDCYGHSDCVDGSGSGISIGECVVCQLDDVGVVPCRNCGCPVHPGDCATTRAAAAAKATSSSANIVFCSSVCMSASMRML